MNDSYSKTHFQGLQIKSLFKKSDIRDLGRASWVGACLCGRAGGSLNFSLCLTSACYRTSPPQAMLYFDFRIRERSSSGSTWRASSVCICVHGQNINQVRKHLAS